MKCVRIPTSTSFTAPCSFRKLIVINRWRIVVIESLVSFYGVPVNYYTCVCTSEQLNHLQQMSLFQVTDSDTLVRVFTNLYYSEIGLSKWPTRKPGVCGKFNPSIRIHFVYLISSTHPHLYTVYVSMSLFSDNKAVLCTAHCYWPKLDQIVGHADRVC